MTLTLDHIQRLNLYFVMGQQRGPVADMRLFWKLIERIELTDKEKEEIGFKLKEINGGMQPSWDATKKLDPVAVEVTEEEHKRIHKMLEEWQPGFMAGFDRLWLEPLLAQLENNSNGRRVQ